MIDLIAQHHGAIAALCRKYGVLRLDLFGSASTGDFDPATSDLDFIATFAHTEAPGYLGRFLDFADALEALFGRPVDLLTENMIHNRYFRQSVEATRQHVYAEQDTQAIA